MVAIMALCFVGTFDLTQNGVYFKEDTFEVFFKHKTPLCYPNVAVVCS